MTCALAGDPTGRFVLVSKNGATMAVKVTAAINRLSYLRCLVLCLGLLAAALPLTADGQVAPAQPAHASAGTAAAPVANTGDPLSGPCDPKKNVARFYVDFSGNISDTGRTYEGPVCVE